jgi:tetratricopeptide (TPR) repeat protein
VLRLITVILMTMSSPVWAQDFQAALDHARQLAEEHRYQDVIDVLGAFDDLEDPEARYVVAAELGRAHFHLGDYEAADAAFREAVVLRPQRAETALYLQATSYLTGNRAQAYAIFREIIASGATDLYLAVNLPGERLFLADPEVWSILNELARTVNVDVDRGALLEVEMGMPRTEVLRRLGAPPGPVGEALTARAGPYLSWVFAFDEADALTQIMLHNEHLYRYTPYRLQFSDQLDWQATPAAATRTFGAPVSTSRSDDEIVIMVWERDRVRLTFEFAQPRSPTPPGLAVDEPVLRVVRMEAIVEDPPSASMNQ